MFKKPNSKYIVIGIAGVVLIALCISIILITVNRKAVKKSVNSVAEETVPVTQKETQINKSTEETKTESVTEITTEETTVGEAAEESTAEEVVALGNEEVNNGDSNNYDNSSNNNEEQGNNNNSGDSNNSGSYEPVYTPPVTQPETEAPQAHIAYKADGTWDLQKTYFDNAKATVGIDFCGCIVDTSEFQDFINSNNLRATRLTAQSFGGNQNNIYISDYLFIVTNEDGSKVKCKYNRDSNVFYLAD